MLALLVRIEFAANPGVGAAVHFCNVGCWGGEEEEKVEEKDEEEKGEGNPEVFAWLLGVLLL